MQVISSALKAALIDIDARVSPRTLVDTFEFYDYDYVPTATGFDPNNAVETFAGLELTWNGIAYRREAISRGDISRNMGEKTNSVTLTFSNISRYMATLAQSQEMEGLLLVIRTVVPSVTDDSIVLFVGRCDKPSDIDKKTFTISARQDFGNINQTLPPRKFTSEDPEGRLPNDPLYEGVQFHSAGGSFTRPEVVPSTSFFGRLFGRRDTKYHTEQWSSVDGTPYGQVVPEIFGRCQMQLIPFAFADKGLFVTYLMAISNGPIDDVSEIKSRTEGFSDPFNLPGNIPAVVHKGDLGGTGTNQGNTNQPDLGGGQVFSHLAYLEGASTGSELDQVDSPPVITALIRGRRVSLPNGSGVYSLEGWTDNPVHIARFILTDPAFVGINEAFMEDSVNYLTGLHCDEPLLDDANDQIIVIPNPDLPVAGGLIRRFRSTSVLTSRLLRFNEFGELTPQDFEDGPYTGVDLADTPLLATERLLIRRYRFSSPITGEVKAVDFLHKTVFPTFRGFLRVNKRGKYEIRSEIASDATYVRTVTAVGATSVPVLDVTPWKTGPDLLIGRALTSFGLIHAEVRDVSSADFSTSGNSITLTASKTGGVTVSASGATLSGGSTSAQASGTVTIGGSPAAGDTVTVTIDGIAVIYTLDSTDTLNTVAGMLAFHVNATLKLRQYIKAEWSSSTPTILTIKCLHGALNLNTTLLKEHYQAIPNPITAPTIAAASGGTFPAGTYYVAYADANTSGSTALTPMSSVVLTANQKINVSGLPSFPGGAAFLDATERHFYISERADSQNLRLSAVRTNAADFSITAVPLPGASLPPSKNTSADELIRVAMSFATNSQDIFPAWPASALLILNDVYLPTTLNGHKYRVTTAGTTGTTEPTWPTTAGGTVASGTAVFTEIGSTALQQTGLTRANVIKDSFKWPLGSRQSSVNQIKGAYRDAKNDFALTPVKVNDPVHQAQVKKIFPLEFDGSGIDNFHQFNRIANGLLSKNREGDWFVSLGTGPQGLLLEEGDVVSASDDSGGLVNVVVRIEDIRIRPNHEVIINQARKYSTRMFSDEVGSHNIPVASTLRFSQTVDSIAEFIDNFAIRDADALVPGFYVAVSRDLADDGDWRGWALYANYGDGYVKIASGDVAAVMGTATSTLFEVDPSVPDLMNALSFHLDYATDDAQFTSCTFEDLYANPKRNLFLYGDEYVQAATINTIGGTRNYTALDLLRGRFGTDGDELTHSASERVVYLNGAEQFVPVDLSTLNKGYTYKVVTVNQDIADVSAVPFTWTGKTLIPLTVVNVRGTRDSAGNLLIEFEGRTRMGGGLRSYQLGGLNEEAEDYRVQILSGGSATLPNGEERVIPVLVGMTQAALLESNSPFGKFGNVDRNNLSNTTFGATVLAASVQTVEATGNDLEASLRLAGFNGETCGFGIIPASFPWRTATLTSIYSAAHLLIVHQDAIPPSAQVWEFGTNVYSTDAEDSRYRIVFAGDEVRVYHDWTGSAGEHIYTTGIAPRFPYRVIAFCSQEECYVDRITLKTIPFPKTIYSTSQQVKDFGSAQKLIQVRVRQESRIVGPGRELTVSL